MIQTLLPFEKQKVKAIRNITDPEVDKLHTASAEEKFTHHAIYLCYVVLVLLGKPSC